jgi:hypothetical protein
MKKAKVIDLGINTYRIDTFRQHTIWWWKNQEGCKINEELLERVRKAKIKQKQ